MTAGIYALYWEEQDLIYIGQSQDIEKRFRDHLSSLRLNKHTNYRVQNAFKLYGVPVLIVIERAKLEELNKLEVFWTKEFNTLTTGLNIIDGGIGTGFGPNNNNSKYTRLEILKLFRHLYLKSYKHLSLLEISKRLNIGIDTIELIKARYRHKWIEEEFPYQYKLMSNLIRDRTNNVDHRVNLVPGGIYLKSPSGITTHISNIRKFARENKLDASNIRKVLNGKYSHCGGWTIP